MPIRFRDYIEFAFGDGKGVLAGQVDGFTGIHYTFDLAYNYNTNKYDGTFTPTIASIEIGGLVAFETPDTIPNNDLEAVCSLPVGGVDTDFTIKAQGFSVIKNSSLAPSTLYWSRVSSGLTLVILSSTSAGAVTRRVYRTITNSELKALDTNYIELVPSPGAGKHIRIRGVSLKKQGDDQPATFTREFRFYSSTSDTLNATEAEAGYTSGVIDSNTRSHRTPPVEWDEARYLYVGVHATQPDIVEIAQYWRRHLTQVQENRISEFTRVPGVIDIAGESYKFWKSNDTFDSAQDWLGGASGNDYQIFWEVGRLDLDFITRYAALALLLPFQNLPKPLLEQVLSRTSSHYLPPEFTAPYTISIADLLAAGNFNEILSVGNLRLKENVPLEMGMIMSLFQGFRPFYTRPDGDMGEAISVLIRAEWDTYMTPVNDVTFDVAIDYSINSR